MSKADDIRIFTGWDRPIVDCVADHLAAGSEVGAGSPLDLKGILIVLPTRQAGRHLREALTRWCGKRGAALLSAHTVTPAFFLRNRSRVPANEVSPGLAKAVWARILMRADLAQYKGLFPAEVGEQTYAWALHTGEMLESVRAALSDAGHRASDVPGLSQGELEEVERWKDIGRLEELYLQELEALGYVDAVSEKIKNAAAPELPEEFNRIVVAGVPAPTPLMLKALKGLSESGAPMEILVHAPAEMSADFDDWGQPLASAWVSAEIEIPEFENSVRLSANPETQAKLACQVIAEAPAEVGPNDVALGVPDHSVAPFLSAFLAAKGLPAYDPAERPVSSHPLYRLIEAFCDLAVTHSYDAFSRLLRHPEVLNCFISEGISLEKLLTALDKFQNLHIPLAFADITVRFQDGEYHGPGSSSRFAPLAGAVDSIKRWLAGLEASGLEEGLRTMLKDVYAARKVIGDTPMEKELESVAVVVDKVLRECSEAVDKLGLSTGEAIDLLLRRLGDEGCAPERENAVMDLEGWLELPWNSAELMVITGMNEGSVPDSRLGDVFLPDVLRRAIDLPNDETRLARDIYLLSSMLASRGERGKVILIVGKYSAMGDPLKPSRLLFRCCDDELLMRTEHLLGGIDEPQKNFAFNRSFLLDASAPASRPIKDLLPTALSATQFSKYLRCPFRFYLSSILRMKELDDEMAGLEPTDFGSMLHEVLEVIAREETLRACSDETVIAAALHNELAKWISDRFGEDPPLTVQISAASARQRLIYAAKVQAAEVASGWVILEKPEKQLSTTINGFPVTGRIDRIDKNVNTGVLRIVDYKSSSKPDNPKKSHLSDRASNPPPIAVFKIKEGSKEKKYSWKDLQLPLYSHMVREEYKTPEPVAACYFNLPKAVTQTELKEWDGLSEELIEESLVCAGRIIEAIKDCRFWPAADQADFDDFESIITGTLAESVDEGKFKAFLGKGGTP